MKSHLLVTLVLVFVVQYSVSQSNYADQANNVEYQGEGLPEQATLDGKVTKLDDLSPVIFLNRTKAALNCAAGSMQVELKFNDKYFGIAYADFDRNSACQVVGKGNYSYKLELPLKGCGTKQEPQRVFTNNIVVRFHPSLELDGDEIITIVCRYPPPVAPIPAGLPNFIQEEVAPVTAIEPPLKGFQILLIICAILFLSLLLLGLGCSYYCLRNRRLTVIKHPLTSVGSGSEITKLSGSSLGNLSMFEGLKIPRAHAQAVAAAPSTSGSDGALISDTLPSDYPSESHSEIEEVDTRSIPSVGSFENKAFVQDNSSFSSENYGHVQEQSVQNAIATPIMVPRLPVAIKEGPRFDVQVRVKKSPPPPPASLSLSDSESSVSRIERNLSTILEQREESVRSMESPSPMVERTTFTYVPELHPPPKHIQPAPTFTRILRRQQELQEPARSFASAHTEVTDTHSVTEFVDDTHSRLVAPAPPPPPPIVPKQIAIQSVPPMTLEPPIIPKPDVSTHNVDDVFLRTITEKKTIEDIERHKRLITEYHAKMKQAEDQKWDVTIKNYPGEKREPPEWEDFSDISSASGLTIPRPERVVNLPPPTITDNKLPLNAPELVSNLHQTPARPLPAEDYLSTYQIPLENPEVPNWNVLIRVFQPIEEETHVIENAETFNSQLTHADRIKWKQIITTESTLRSMLTEATVREDFERIRMDHRYEKLFEPPKWDVIIRILTPIEKPKLRYKKKGEWDTRSRRSSLPTLYEYDSDGGSSRTEPSLHQQRSRRNSRSSYRSETDLRSMSEMMVEYGRESETSSYYRPRFYEEEPVYGQHPIARSLSQPSLARSASEFTERWVAPSRYDTASEFTTPEGTPKSQRSSRMAGEASVWQTSAQSQQVRRSPGGTTQVQSQFRSEASSSFVSRSGATKKKSWFGDDSE